MTASWINDINAAIQHIKTTPPANTTSTSTNTNINTPTLTGSGNFNTEDDDEDSDDEDNNNNGGKNLDLDSIQKSLDQVEKELKKKEANRGEIVDETEKYSANLNKAMDAFTKPL